MNVINKFEILSKLQQYGQGPFCSTFLLVVALCMLPGVHVFSQIKDQNDVISKTAVEYDSCSQIATITFPVSTDGVCASIATAATLLRWMEIYSKNPNNSETLVAKVSANGFTHEGSCSIVSYTTTEGFYCRGFNLCSDGSRVKFRLKQYDEIPGGVIGERYVELIVPSLTGSIRLIGDYDFGDSGGDNGFDINFVKQDLSPQADCDGYKTPPLNFSSSIRFVNVVALPDPVCADESGVSTTSKLDALNADESEYLLAKKGTPINFSVNVGSFNQIPLTFTSTIEVFYIENAGTPNELIISKGSQSISSPVGPTGTGDLQQFPVSHTPQKGSLGDIIHIRIVATSGTNNIYIPVAVEGAIDEQVPILGEFKTPQLPFLILHDPPGDGSFAEFTLSDKVCKSESTSFVQSEGIGGSITAQIGFEGSAGFLGTIESPFKFTIATSASFEYTLERDENREVKTCVEYKSEYQTGDTESEIGESADRFIGTASRLKYGIYDQVKVENCILKIETGLIYTVAKGNDIVPFNYTEERIRAEVMALNDTVNNLSKDLTIREQAYNQIEVWEDILDRNESNRENANYVPGGDYTSSAPQKESKTASNTSTYSINYNIATSKELAIEVTALAAGNGIFGGPQFSWNTSRDASITNEAGEEITISYTIQDDQDDFLYSTAIDPDFGTPMFRLSNSASTSCPYEGGNRLYAPHIYVDQNNQECPYITRDNISTDSIEMLITVYNPDQLDRSFSIWANTPNVTLPDLKLDGRPLTELEVVTFGTVKANSTLTKLLVLKKNSSRNRYDDIYLRVFAKCMADNAPPDIEDLPSWIANENDSLIINVTFGGPGNYPPDLDCDGIPNDIDPDSTMICEGDDDCDGILNAVDACPLDPNNTDTDLDGIPDCIDLCADQESTLNFDRSSSSSSDNQADFVTVPHHDALNLAGKEFTIEAWVHPTDDFYKTIIAKGGATVAETNFAWVIWNRDVNDEHNGKLGLLLNDEWQYSDNQIPLNRWTHIAVTFEKDGQQAEFYIDGQFSGRKRYSSSATTANSNAMTIGVWELGSTQPNTKQWGFKGSMDELSIWDRKLEQEEIQTRMSHALAPFTPGLIAYYKFDGNAPCMAGGSNKLFDSGPNVFEIAGSPFNGTLMSFNTNSNSCISNWSEGRNADVDEDGLGDICSFDAGLSQDSDNDGYSDLIDLCPNTHDAALHFDGTNRAQSISNPNIVGNSSFSFSAWIYPTSDEFLTIAAQGTGAAFQTPFILTKINAYGSVFDIKDHNKIGLYLFNGTNYFEVKLSNSAVALNEWSHVVVIVSGGVATFYINGKYDGSQTFSFTNYFSSGNLYIGSLVGGGSQFQGRLDDLSFWNKNLSLEEVKSLYSTDIVGDETNLIAAYKFNEGIPCQDNSAITNLIDATGSFPLLLINFDVANASCSKNWTRARNTDSDDDGIGDACETSTFACAVTAGTGGPGSDFDYLEDCLDFCPTSTETSLHFNGFNDFVYVNNHEKLNLADGSFTLELWIKPDQVSEDVSLINKGHGIDATTIYNLVIKGPEVPQLKHKVGLNVSGYWFFSNSRINMDEWTHIAVTFKVVDNNTRSIRFYINGELDSQPRTLTLPSNTTLYNNHSGSLRFGRDESGITGLLIGSVEDIIIWEDTLSPEMILRTMEASLQGDESNLVAYYKFDDGIPFAYNAIPAANTLVDSGPNGLNGILQDFALVGVASNWAPGRNLDSDGDGMGDGCDDGLPCPPNYAGMNALDMTLLFSNNYETQGIIETSQMINSPINLIYNSATAVQLLPGFEVKQAVLEIKTTGCSQN